MRSPPEPATMPMRSLCFFNNKGGVGKTTLACNVASQLARTSGLRVLLVDADPQCNATQLILTDEQTRELYVNREIGEALTDKKFDTLRDVLSPFVAGDATLDGTFSVVDASTNRFGVNLLPGHPEVALLEDKLSQNWNNFIGGDLGGARVTNWNTQLLCHLRDKYDLVIYDVGPSLGALNRAVLVGVDYFLAPMGCDIFSLIGIDNIASWLDDWQGIYKHSLELCERRHKGTLGNYEIRTDEAGMCRFVGYTVQQYITKTIRKERRATGAYEEILVSIPKRIAARLTSLVAAGLSADDLALGDVPHMYSLVPLAQTAHAPIDGLTAKDGLSGGQYGQQSDYLTFISALSNSLLKNLRRTGAAREGSL